MNPFFWKSMERLRILCKAGGAFCLAGMTLLTCVDVVGRKLGHPIFGSVELVGFMATLAAALALPYTHQVQGHIGVEIVVKNFSQRTQKVFDLCTNLVGLLFFVLVTWRMFIYAGTIRASGEVSMNLKFPEHLIILTVGVSFLVFCLTIFEEIVTIFKDLKEKS
jgi:TRAP-type C4-dicarboxylate transport system permease small subunit